MSVEVTGINETIGDLEKELGKTKMKQISDAALEAGAKVFVEELKRQVSTFSDGKGYSEGYTLEEITISKPFWDGGVRTISVHWKGPHGRYRIIHLNEWGTIKNPNPRGKGKIALALKNSEQAYINAVRKALEEGL